MKYLSMIALILSLFGATVLIRPHRTTARAVLFLAAILGLAAGTAGAAPPKVPDHIIFPVVGRVSYIDDFGEPRPGSRSADGAEVLGSDQMDQTPAFGRSELLGSDP